MMLNILLTLASLFVLTQMTSDDGEGEPKSVFLKALIAQKCRPKRTSRRNVKRRFNGPEWESSS